ncbi:MULTISPECIES: DUF3826 domain-containing protein [Niastella]|uniref:DUF3826 domain-containing protein n=1 Tax=Niastella soli TaxID=2821487 RepID=A0ABS3Z3D6_9BACT|nr:DUF3826 domain-containing protein [Niastella soli]MBO9203906.1 DUF3826 domain-containing protein [Niastella soli]
MMKRLPIIVLLTFTLPVLCWAQTDSAAKAAAATAKSNAEVEKKAAEWAAGLKLADAGKEKRVAAAVTTHLKTIRDWNNEHPFTTVPAGINPATGNKLSEMDRQIIANSAMPASVHKDLMDILNKDLTPEQVEYILDQYTIGKVAFTMKGYKAIVTDLKPEEEAKILEYLKQAREQAIDYKSIKQVSAIFEIYKTKCEQYLNSNGRNWKELFKAYVNKVKAEKAAAGKK